MKRLMLTLVIMLAAAAFGLAQETPQARLIDEFGASPNGYVKMKMDSFYRELMNDPAAQGYVINYGTEREIAVRERQIAEALRFGRFEASRLTIVRGGLRVAAHSEFWVVPAGAANPQPSRAGEKIDEFGKIPEGEFKARVDSFFAQLGNRPEAAGYAVFFGPAKLFAAEKKRFENYVRVRRFDPARVVFRQGGGGAARRTEFWLLPPAGTGK